jgi:diacylglycerol kinase
MHAIDPAERAFSTRAVTEDDREGGVDRAEQAGQGRPPEIGVLIDPGRDERMRDLHEQRRGPAEEQEALAVDTSRDRVDSQDPCVAHTRSVPLVRAFRFALEGAIYVIRSERNVRIQLVVGAAATAVGIWLGLGPVEWAVLALTMGLVIGLEWLNTAVEITVSLASPEEHPLAKAAKDVAAASVLVGAIASVAIGVFLFGPRLVARLFGP